MTTVLIVTSDSVLRSRLLRVSSDASTFLASSDAEALKTLRLVDVEVIFRDSRSPLRALNAFVAQVKALTPTVQVVAIGPGDEEAEAADFALPAAFSQLDLEATMRQLGAKQQLIREVTALRPQPPSAAMSVSGEGTAREAPALARVLKEFSRVLAAGFNLPRVLDMFLDAIGEFLLI
jgi:DNA-binding NtrC family response regulator